jgi:hypothetical protein
MPSDSVREALRGYDAQMTSRDDPNGSEPSGVSELERFEALAKKLVYVPKAEIDKARKKGQAALKRRQQHA